MMRIWVLRTIVVAAGFGLCGPVLAQAPIPVPAPAQAPAPVPIQIPTGQPQTFTHAERGYSLLIPAGAETQRGDKHDILIQSRKGYRITVQSANRAEGDTLEAMLGRLEALHLGEEKTWNRKIGVDGSMIAGLPALSATYEGARTRTRVVLVRGSRIDTVFMFFVPPARFEELVNEFDWLLEHYTPAPEDRARAATAAAPAAQGLPAAAEWPRHSDPALGYLIAYSRDWTLHRVSDSAVVFAGPETLGLGNVTVAIQNARPAQPSPRDGAIFTVQEDLKAQFRALPGAEVGGESVHRHMSSGVMLSGRQFLVTYAERGAHYRQWTVLIPHGEGPVPLIHVFSFRAPLEVFEAARPIAARMLDSLTLHGVRRDR